MELFSLMCRLLLLCFSFLFSFCSLLLCDIIIFCCRPIEMCVWRRERGEEEDLLRVFVVYCYLWPNFFRASSTVQCNATQYSSIRAIIVIKTTWASAKGQTFPKKWIRKQIKRCSKMTGIEMGIELYQMRKSRNNWRNCLWCSDIRRNQSLTHSLTHTN